MGDNFGLNDHLSYYELEFDSLDATSSYIGGVAATDWPLFQVAAKGPLQDIVAIKVLEVQIPFSWYVFNSRNNSFTLIETGGSPLTVTIPIGNYTASALVSVMQTALNAVGISNTYTVSYSTVLGKFSFLASTVGFSFTFGLPTNSGNVNPRLYIGFPGGVTFSSGLLLTAPNVDLTSGPNYVYLNSAKLGSDVDVFLPAGAFNLGGGQAGPQIAKIPVNCNPGGIVMWQDPDPQKWFKYDQLQSLNTMDFFLTLGNTTTQTPLQLNGLSFSLKIGILRALKTNVQRTLSTAHNGRVTRREGPVRLNPTF